MQQSRPDDIPGVREPNPYLCHLDSATIFHYKECLNRPEDTINIVKIIFTVAIILNGALVLGGKNRVDTLIAINLTPLTTPPISSKSITSHVALIPTEGKPVAAATCHLVVC